MSAAARCRVKSRSAVSARPAVCGPCDRCISAASPPTRCVPPHLAVAVSLLSVIVLSVTVLAVPVLAMLRPFMSLLARADSVTGGPSAELQRRAERKRGAVRATDWPYAPDSTAPAVARYALWFLGFPFLSVALRCDETIFISTRDC
jgi:hypothetical protein